MNILKDKANENLEASEYLINEEMFSPSIHCSYYSCLQLMRHILFNIYGVIESEYDERPEVKNKGSHVYSINFFRNELHNKKISYREFEKKIRDLKLLRKSADYKETIILSKDSAEALKIAIFITNLLKNTYDL